MILIPSDLDLILVLLPAHSGTTGGLHMTNAIPVQTVSGGMQMATLPSGGQVWVMQAPPGMQASMQAGMQGGLPQQVLVQGNQQGGMQQATLQQLPAGFKVIQMQPAGTMQASMGFMRNATAGGQPFQTVSSQGPSAQQQQMQAHGGSLSQQGVSQGLYPMGNMAGGMPGEAAALWVRSVYCCPSRMLRGMLCPS